MIKKSYLNDGKTCRVTFRVPQEANAATVVLTGDFTGWDEAPIEMPQRKDGSFSTTVNLKPGQSYRFRYILDGERWANDDGADSYVENPFGSDDSIVTV